MKMGECPVSQACLSVRPIRRQGCLRYNFKGAAHEYPDKNRAEPFY